MNNDEHWQTNFKTLKAYIAEHGHLPNHHKPKIVIYIPGRSIKGRRLRKVRWMTSSENCLNHYSQLVQPSILGGEGRIEHSPPVFL